MAISKDGWVYILTNPALPGMVKLGHTTSTPEARARQLDGTGLPEKFKVVYAAYVPHPQDVEALAHARLKDCRVSRNREFFRCTSTVAIGMLQELCENHLRIELVCQGKVTSVIFALRLGECLSCPKCGQLIRPFNSALTEINAGLSQCAFCGHKIRFKVLMPAKPSLPTKRSLPTSFIEISKVPRPTIVGDFARSPVVDFECPYCKSHSRVPPSSTMRCRKCGRHSAP